jgi:integrase
MARTGSDAAVLRRALSYDPQIIPQTQRLVDGWSADLAKRQTAQRRHLASASGAALRRGIRAWLRHLAQARCDAPTSTTVDDFVAQTGRTHRAATVALYRAAVRSLYRWAAAQGLGEDIACDVQAGGGATADPPLPTLNDAEYARLRRVIAGNDLRSHRDRALLACLRAIPVETIAWARATVGAVDLEAQTVRLAPRGLPSAWRRGRAEASTRIFALSTEAVSRLHSYLDQRGPAGARAPLFTSTRDGGALTTLAMRLTVLRCLEAAGLRAPSPGLARNRLLYRYPEVDAAGLQRAELPTDPAGRACCRALLHLLALPSLRIPWERLGWDALDDRCTTLTIRRATRGASRQQAISLPAATAAVLRTWRNRSRGSGLVFCAADGRPLSHHTLKRIAWAAFPDRMPSGPPTMVGSSSRRLRRG